jgi:hypothetical protein
VALVLAMLVVSPAAGYLKFGFSDGQQSRVLKWVDDRPVTYHVGDRGVTGVSAGQFDAALARAFRTWEDVTSATIRFARGGVVGGPLSDNDGVTHLAFDSRPDLDRTLASTSYTVDLVTAEILEVDVFFNEAFPWTVAESGQAGRFDLESIALHEIGHLTGLGHSALGETERQPSGSRRLLSAGAVMFPIAFSPGSIAGRRLQPDDIAGLSDIYPDTGFRARTGSVSGRVLRDGIGLLGAHVTAFHLRTGDLVAGFTLDLGGNYVLAGLEPGPVVLRVEPLDDGDVESFLSGPGVDADFRAAFFDRVVFVPAGGNVSGLDITVRRP